VLVVVRAALQLDQRARARVPGIAHRRRQLAQQLAHRGVAARQLVVVLRGWDHHDLRIAFAAPVDASESLDHALPGHQIRDHVLGIEIDADLARGRRDDERRPF